MNNRESFDTLAPEFRVHIDGAEVPEPMRADLVALRVLEDLHATGMFALTLNCWNSVEMKVKWIDDELFTEGKTVTLFMGYRDQMAQLFTGEINGLEPDFHTEEAPVLTVRGYDRAHRLMRQRKSKTYVQMKDSQIAQQVASQAGMSAEVQDSGVTLEYVLQHNQTDLEFLRDRAARIGYEVFVSESKLYFRAPKTAEDAALTLRREVELLEFYPRSTTLSQVEKVDVKGWNPKKKESIIGKSSSGDVRGMAARTGPAVAQRAFSGAASTGVLSPAFSQQEVDALARASLNTTALGYVTGEGVCIGRPDLRPGKVVNIEGIGRRFSGSYYVTSVEHSYLPSRGYRTHFAVRRNATG